MLFVNLFFSTIDIGHALKDPFHEFWGLQSFEPHFHTFCGKLLREPPWYGTACPVVWGHVGSNPAFYPISPAKRVACVWSKTGP